METSMNDISATGATSLAHAAGTTSSADAAKHSLTTLETQTAAAEDKNSRQVDMETLKAATGKAQALLAESGVSLKFTIIEETGQIQVQMLGGENNKVILTIPSDELVKMSASVNKKSGNFLNSAV